MYQKLSSDTNMLDIYYEVFQKERDVQFVDEMAKPTQESPNIHYLPQVYVAKHSKTTPLHITIDVSAKGTNGVSLNDYLY